MRLFVDLTFIQILLLVGTDAVIAGRKELLQTCRLVVPVVGDTGGKLTGIHLGGESQQHFFPILDSRICNICEWQAVWCEQGSIAPCAVNERSCRTGCVQLSSRALRDSHLVRHAETEPPQSVCKCAGRPSMTVKQQRAWSTETHSPSRDLAL